MIKNKFKPGNVIVLYDNMRYIRAIVSVHTYICNFTDNKEYTVISAEKYNRGLGHNYVKSDSGHLVVLYEEYFKLCPSHKRNENINEILS